jgi:serine protease Do
MAFAGLLAPSAAQPLLLPPASFAPALIDGLKATVSVYGVYPPSDESEEVPQSHMPGGAGFGPVSLGSGFFLDDKGLIATAAHVVAGASQVVVMLADQRSLVAETVGQDAAMDIAVLRVAQAPALEPPLGRSDTLRAGDWVLAVGDPYGTGRTVVAGIVGGQQRHFADDEEVLFIQSDLALNPGNSGGPLISAGGRIVGMNTRMMMGAAGSSGLALSIPIEIVQRVAAELQAGNRAATPRLGARFYDVPPPLAVLLGRPRADGALVGEVSAGSVASRLGLLPGDIVVGMNGRAVGDGTDFARALYRWRSERNTTLVVFRAGGYRELRLR